MAVSRDCDCEDDMSSMTWRYLAGDTAAFAIELALIRDDMNDFMVDKDTRQSWGSLALWVAGVNVCEYSMEGESLKSSHWYLLPVAEWLTDNWDALLHEERLLIPEAGGSAARASRRTAVLAESEISDLVESWQDWQTRHNLRSAAPGALLPDLYIRRYGDLVEFSIGGEPFAGGDWGITPTPLPLA